MSTIACPGCHADVDSDLVASRRSADCPYCGAQLPQAKLAAVLTGADRAADRDRDLRDPPRRFQAARGDATDPARIGLPELPLASRIQILEADRDHLVLFLPGGGRNARSLGFFAVMWNGIVGLISVPFLIGFGQQAQGLELLFAFGFLSIFWIIGLVLAGIWAKLKFERTLIAVDHTGIVLQRTLFQRQRREEYTLTPASHARLVESYSENHRPVYRVEIDCAEGAAKFGTPLPQDEKDWLVTAINRFLGAEAPPADWEDHPAVASALGSTVPALFEAGLSDAGGPDDEPLPQPDDLSPERLPADSPVRIEQDQPRHLSFSFPLLGHVALRSGVAFFLLLFGGLWTAIVVTAGILTLFAGPNADPLGLLCVAPMLIPGLVVLLIGLAVQFGRVTVDLTDERLSIRWHLFFVGKSWQFSTPELRSVRVERNVMRFRVNRQPRQFSTVTCRIRGAGQDRSLGTGHPPKVVHQIAGLLRGRLRQMGIRLEHV